MIHVTGPAVLIALVIGYFGVNAVINGISELFSDRDRNENQK